MKPDSLNAFSQTELRVRCFIFTLLASLLILEGCGASDSHDETEIKFLTGAGPTRGHEDITRLGANLANDRSEELLGQRPFPEVLSGVDGALSENPLIKGNYETDFPSARMLAFYGAGADTDWHHDGGLQQIHSLRAVENGQYRSNRASCLLQQKTIATATYKALDLLRSGDRDGGLYWLGHATHIIQDSFSAAHTQRLEPDGRRITEFCTYGRRIRGICYHETVDLRDRVWHEGLSCQANPMQRNLDCLRGEAQWAVDATASYLKLMARLVYGSDHDDEAELTEYFTQNRQAEGGYFDCGAIPDLQLGIAEISIESSQGPLALCHSNWWSGGADLNDGAGGKFIELCYQAGESANPITGLMAVSGRDATCPASYEKLSNDLNEGAGGDYIFLCVSRAPGKPIAEIKITSDKHNANRCGEGWAWLDMDLNKGASGKFVYLCYH
ncbi:MAG: hypothetical protein NTX25_10950 [Proteobacteria bacterium]|nr:hypothetical protein [Pseudomonadota bacterium]